MADKRKGWVLLYRSIRESWVWDTKPFDPARAWIDLILDANHEDGKFYLNGKLMNINRGQKWTSIRVLAERWGWGNTKVLKFLKALEQDGMITRKSTKSGTLLTIVNYGDFQSRKNANGTQTEHRRNTDGTKQRTQKEGLKEGKKEASLSEGEKTGDDINTDTSYFDSLEDENDTDQEH